MAKIVSTFKFLGLHLTENLSCEVHIKSYIINIIPVCRAIFRTRHYLTYQMKRTVCFALVHSHLTSSTTWAHCYNQDLCKLITQKRALEIIFGSDPRMPSVDLYNKLNGISVSKYMKRTPHTSHKKWRSVRISIFFSTVGALDLGDSTFGSRLSLTQLLWL